MSNDARGTRQSTCSPDGGAERRNPGGLSRFPGFRFTLLGTPDGHGDYVRLAWALGPDGSPAPIEGSDVVTLEGGRIRRVIGFIDRAPAG